MNHSRTPIVYIRIVGARRLSSAIVILQAGFRLHSRRERPGDASSIRVTPLYSARELRHGNYFSFGSIKLLGRLEA